MESDHTADARLPAGFETELARLVHGTLARCMAQLQRDARAQSNNPQWRQCQDVIEQLWLRRQALVRTLLRPTHGSSSTPSNLRQWARADRPPAPSVLDAATADAARTLQDAVDSEWPEGLPAPTACAAALRRIVEHHADGESVQIDLMQLATAALVPEFVAVCRGRRADEPAPAPAAVEPAPAPAPRPQELLDGAQPGRWFRMVLHDQWAVARLTWRSENGRFFMFSSELAGRVHSLSRAALEHLIERGHFKALKDEPRQGASRSRIHVPPSSR
jgi:hypothetical protein